MPINQTIRAYLVDQRAQALYAFVSDDAVFNKVRAQLDGVALNEVKRQFYQELVTNCEQLWLKAAEPINGIIFEYDYIYRENEEAVAYGVLFEHANDLNVQAEPYDIVYNYKFAVLFEAVSGVTLRVLNPLAELEEVDDFFNQGGFSELRDAYVFTAFLGLHDALADFVETSAFKRLVRHSPFHFLIQEHDMGKAYPVYIVDASNQVGH